MKILFVYFSEKRMCENAEQAIEFINSLHFHGNENCPKLVVNDKTNEQLHDLFEAEWHTEGQGFPYIEVIKKANCFCSWDKYYDGHDLRTTNCRNTSIKMYYPLGDSIEEHESEYNRRMEEKRNASILRAQAERERREKELFEKREGWYSVSLTYTRIAYPKMNYVESTFTGKCIASSGADAYAKALKEIEKDGEASMGASFPDVCSGNYSFVFLGVKTDDGYTMKELEE